MHSSVAATARVSLVVCSIVGVVSCGGTPTTTSGGAAPVFGGGEGLTIELARDRAPVDPLVMRDLSGAEVSLSELRGKVVLVNFWATWCGPCRQEIPDLIALRDRYPDQLEVIGVSLDESGPDTVRAFVDEFAMDYPVVMSTAEITRHFPGVFALPTTFVLDPEGRVAQRHVGLINPAIIEQELRHLTGLPVGATVQTVESVGTRQLVDAAHATEIPGLDLDALTAEQKEIALQRLNAESCTCGCQLTLAECRINDPACDVSLPLAEQVVDEIVADTPDAVVG